MRAKKMHTYVVFAVGKNEANKFNQYMHIYKNQKRVGGRRCIEYAFIDLDRALMDFRITHCASTAEWDLRDVFDLDEISEVENFMNFWGKLNGDEIPRSSLKL
jgi:hypothetical protein